MAFVLTCLVRLKKYEFYSFQAQKKDIRWGKQLKRLYHHTSQIAEKTIRILTSHNLYSLGRKLFLKEKSNSYKKEYFFGLYANAVMFSRSQHHFLKPNVYNTSNFCTRIEYVSGQRLYMQHWYTIFNHWQLMQRPY